MGIVQLIDPFYTRLLDDTYLRTPVVGQICWLVSPHIDAIPRIMGVERIDPKEHYATKFEIRNMNPSTDFKIKDRLPIYKLNLRATEEILVQRAKKRPAIIIATEFTIFDDVKEKLRSLDRKHLQQQGILVAPLFSVDTPEDPGGFPPIMTARIRSLMYRQFFFCPRKGSPLVHDSVARLDRLHVVLHESSPGVRSPAYDPTQYALSKEALGVIMAMVQSLFGAPESEELKAIRELAMEALPPEAKKFV